MKTLILPKLKQLFLASMIPLFGITLMLILLSKPFVPVVQAANFAVNLLGDAVDDTPGDGRCDIDADLTAEDCTLRAAIQEANASPGLDTITLIAGTYTLTLTNAVAEDASVTGDLDITDDVTITGPDAFTTIIDGNGASGLNDRVFHLLGTSAVTISEVTIQRGRASGVVSPTETLESRGGGIYIEANSSLSLTDVTVRNNNANSYGGGILNLGTLQLNRVTIANNISFIGSGGGLRNDGGLVEGTNVTISGNQAINTGGTGGGIRNINGATTILTNSTIVQNVVSSFASGIRNNPDSVVTLYNTIVANNIGSLNCGNGFITDGGNNLDGGSSCGFPASNSEVSLTFGSLQNNGGSTPTHALPLGSAAVDAGNDTTCATTDQRSQTRVNQPGVKDDTGNICDVGAYEFKPVVSVPSLAISDASIAEGNSGNVNAVFTVTLSGPIATPVTVNFATANGTATTGDNDYVTRSGVITFPSNSTTPQSIAVQIVGDTKVEVDETFFVNLSNSNWATITDAQGEGLISSDDLPVLSISDTAVAEGNSGTTTAVFTLTLASSAVTTATVDYATADGTATTADNDYIAASGTVTFPVNTSSQTITVTVNGDTKPEADEIFLVNLSGASELVLPDSQAEGEITDDDSPRVSISDVTVTEGDTGTVEAVFNVTLSITSALTTTVSYQTADGTATTADNDYVSASGLLSFPPNTQQRTVSITVNGDEKVEPNENFFINLSNAIGANFLDNQGQGTITNDDTGFSNYLPYIVKN